MPAAGHRVNDVDLVEQPAASAPHPSFTSRSASIVPYAQAAARSCLRPDRSG